MSVESEECEALTTLSPTLRGKVVATVVAGSVVYQQASTDVKRHA